MILVTNQNDNIKSLSNLKTLKIFTSRHCTWTPFPIIPTKQHVLILPSQSSALKTQHITQHFLHIVRNLNRRFPTNLTAHLLRQPVQKSHLVRGPRIHEKEVRVPDLDPTHGRAVI